MIIRDATPDDATTCAAIYAPYVQDTAISFETTPPSAQTIAERIAASQRAHAWLAAELDGSVVGYAYAAEFRQRAAYRYSCEVSVYLESGRRRTGAGRALYAVLLDRLIANGYRNAFAGITLPNPASVGLHTALGFTTVGTYHRVGWKHDAWHDVLWMQRTLVDSDAPPADVDHTHRVLSGTRTKSG